MSLAIDISNYSGALSADEVQGLLQAGVELVIVQAVDPAPPFPMGQTREQVQTLLAAGFTVDAYVWLWFDADISDVRGKLALLNGFPIRRLWLDVEDTAARKYDQPTTEAKVQAALAELDGFPASAGGAGIYTGGWFWQNRLYMDNTETFKTRPLWDAHYDGIPDACQGFIPYGGWTDASIKQYQGTTTLAGIPNVDLDVLTWT